MQTVKANFKNTQGFIKPMNAVNNGPAGLPILKILRRLAFHMHVCMMLRSVREFMVVNTQLTCIGFFQTLMRMKTIQVHIYLHLPINIYNLLKRQEQKYITV